MGNVTQAATGRMGYVVVMFDAGEWHGVWAGLTWFEATRAHAGAIGALRVLDHPHAEDVKIIPTGADYSHAPLSEEMR